MEVPKVKKGRSVTRPRPAKGPRKVTAGRTAKAARGKAAAPKPVRKPEPAKQATTKAGAGSAVPGPRKAPARKALRTVESKRARRGSQTGAKALPTRSVKIRELDPLAKCGSGTSVQFLYRVDELLDGTPRAHLVFFDRHGWYCEHGRNCPAVADVRRYGRQHQLFTD